MTEAEGNRMASKDKWTIGISLFSLLAALASMGYTFRATEYGPVFGHPAPSFNYGGKISVTNTLDGVEFKLPFEARNGGTRPFTIGRMKATIRYGDSDHEFPAQSYRSAAGGDWINLGSKTIGPGETWQATLSFAKKQEREDIERKANLSFGIAQYIQTQYLKNPDPRGQYRLDDKVALDKIKDELIKQSDWMKGGEYSLKITVYGKNDAELDNSTSTFQLSTQQLVGLKEYVARSYEYPDVVPGNLFFLYSAAAELKWTESMGSTR